MSSCLTPVHVYNKYLGKMIWTSCGKCSHCLENRRQEWKFRFMKEKEISGLCTHLTLQYDNDHLGDNVLELRDLQLFLKRLRSEGYIFRYYAIGEYGTKDKRKHFHVAIFLRSHHRFSDFKKSVIRQWKSGYIYFTKLTFRRMGYILHYHVRPKVVDNKRTIAVQSKGIGSDWLERPDIVNYMINTNSISIQANDGMFYTVPRYYRKKLGITYEVADNSVPKAVKSYAKKCKILVKDVQVEDLKKHFLEVKKRDVIKLQKYNTKSD